MSKTGTKANRIHAKKMKANAAKDHFDQEDQNLDALEMEDHQDPEYNALLKSSPHANLKKNAYFFNNQRYSGAKHSQQPVEQGSQDQEENQFQDLQDENQIAKALKNLKEQRKKKSQLLNEDIRNIQEEDENFEKLRKKQKSSQQNIQQSLQLKNQLQLYRDMVDIRYNKQNQLESIKKFPHNNIPENQELNSLNKQFQGKVLSNMCTLVDVYYQYAKKAFNIDLNNELSEQYQNESENKDSIRSRLNIEGIYTKFASEQDSLLKQAQKQLVKWSQKTTLIGTSTSHYSSLLMQTPIGQAKKVLSNWDRVSSKSQAKRNDENVRVSSDKQIFDDYELFNDLEKIYISQIEDDNDFRMSDTLRYLKNRQARGEKTKQVDRKASKNRKIRFNIHAKLLNFMPSRPQNLIQARDQIVDNIFNCKANNVHVEKQEGDGQTYFIDM